MFKFYNEWGEEVFSSNDLKEVEKKARVYKKEKKLKRVEITKLRGEFLKFV